jgi:16S rRNA G966 N2-methylase RsmD
MSEGGKIGAEKRWKRGREIDVQESISENGVGQNYTTLSNPPKLAENTKGKGRVIDISAKNAHVSPATYNKGREIIKLAPSQETLNKLRTGKVRIDKVYRELENDRKRQDLISKGANVNLKFPDDVNLIAGDFTEKCKDIPVESIDFIYTDPPYDRESLPIYDKLAKVAATLLKDGGILATNCPQELRCQIRQFMKSNGLTWWWDIAIILEGPWSRIRPKKMIVTWKPLLLFVKGSKPKKFKFIKDLIESERPDKTLDRNIQSTKEAEDIISELTNPGDMVLDPMMGTGTTGIAAIKLKRKFVGIELNEDTLAIARHNISQSSSRPERDQNLSTEPK